MSGCFEGKQFFFEKKACRPRTKELSLLWVMGFDAAKAHEPDSKKFFGSFFKKELLG
jgi:hypothetical protein